MNEIKISYILLLFILSSFSILQLFNLPNQTDPLSSCGGSTPKKTLGLPRIWPPKFICVLGWVQPTMGDPWSGFLNGGLYPSPICR